MSLLAGWNRLLIEMPEQPALFFQRSGHWRWWSFGDVASSVALVSRAVEEGGLGERVNFQLEPPQHELVVDLGVRITGREVVPWCSVDEVAGEPSDRWTPPSPKELPPNGWNPPFEALQPRGDAFVEWDGAVHRLSNHELQVAVADFERLVGPWIAGVGERPIVLAAGSLAGARQRIWTSWAMWRGAVLVGLRSEEELAWATSWCRPHLVLGGATALRAAVDYEAQHVGRGRFRRRFDRLAGWVVGAGGRSAVEDDRKLDEWRERGVEVSDFPSMPWCGNLVSNPLE